MGPGSRRPAVVAREYLACRDVRAALVLEHLDCVFGGVRRMVLAMFGGIVKGAEQEDPDDEHEDEDGGAEPGARVPYPQTRAP